MNSMTGFGSGKIKWGDDILICEIRSVNHKFCSVRINLPDKLASIEPILDIHIRKNIQRGSVNVQINLVSQFLSLLKKQEIKHIKNLFKEIASVKKSLKIKEPPQLETILSLNRLWEQANSHDLNGARFWPKVRSAVTVALNDLTKMREIEGVSIYKDLNKRIKNIEEFLKFIQYHAPMMIEHHRDKIVAKLTELAGEKAEAQYREIAQLIDKGDISEELQRLQHHIVQFKKYINSSGLVGRKLDFLIQEMHREANTIASKASDSKIVHATIDIKTEIERIKEQVENVE